MIKVEREAVRYEIVRSLGKGGMGRVFLARSVDDAGISAEVALKCITPYMELDEQTRKDFLYEAQVAVRLRHPNIVEAYKLVQVRERNYLVLEFVEGASLKEMLTAVGRGNKELSAGFCCYVAASVAEGLDYAHRRTDVSGRPLGIVHRDVKPDNVMIAESGAVKLLDFGVAYARFEGRDRTQTGLIKGTYDYMSPEQAARSHLDGRSDLFSLGLLLVELLTGTRVFGESTDLETLQQVREFTVMDATEMIEQLPPGLQGICEKALARRPDDRFQSGAEYSRALRKYLLEQGISYWASDCAAEARALGAFTVRTSDENVEPVRAAANASIAGSRAVRGDREPSRAPTRQVSRAPLGMRRWPLAVGLGVGLAAVLAMIGLMRQRSHTPSVSPANLPALIVEAPPKPNQVSAPVVVQSPGFGAVAESSSTPAENKRVVRPRKKQAVGRAALKGDEGRSGGIAALPQAPVVASSRLPRGTLVRARLSAPVDPARTGAVEAIVAENLLSGGSVLVPPGSALLCTSRESRDGRVPVSCDGIKTADRSWSFSGLAVGDGQRVGLRVVDSSVPAGSSFVVYVDAEFR